MRKLLGNSLIFTVSNVLLQALSFILLPLYSNIISTSEYGIISNINTIVFLCNLIISMRLDGAMSRYYFSCESEEDRKKLFTKLNLFLFFISTTGYSLIIAILWPLISNKIGKDIWLAIVMAILTKYFDNFYSMVSSYLIAKQEAKTVSVIAVCSGALNLVSTYLLVTKMDNKVIAYILSFLVVSILRMFIVLYYQKLLWYPIRKFWEVKEYVCYSVNLLPVELAYWIINTSDRLVITALIGTSSTGVYSMGSNFAHIVNIFIDSFNKAYVPFVFSQLGRDSVTGAKNVICRINQYFVAGATLIVGGVFVFVPSIIEIFNKAYAGSAGIAMVLTVSTFFYGIMQSYNVICNYYVECMSSKAKLISLCALLNIVLNIFFVNMMGVIGAAVATVICYALIALGIKCLADKRWKMMIDTKKRVFTYILTLTYLVFAWAPLGYKGFMLRILVSVVYVLLVVGINVISGNHILKKGETKNG